MNKPKRLTLAQKVEGAILLARFEGTLLRSSNAALAKTKASRIINDALSSCGGELVTNWESKGRGAHYRFPDDSRLGAELVSA